LLFVRMFRRHRNDSYAEQACREGRVDRLRRSYWFGSLHPCSLQVKFLRMDIHSYAPGTAYAPANDGASYFSRARQTHWAASFRRKKECDGSQLLSAPTQTQRKKHAARKTPRRTILPCKNKLAFSSSLLRCQGPRLGRSWPASIDDRPATGNRQHAARWSDQQSNSSESKTKNASFHWLRWPRVALAKSDLSQVTENSVAGALARVLQDNTGLLLLPTAFYCFLSFQTPTTQGHTKQIQPITKKQATEANVSTRDVILFRSMRSDTGATARWAHATVPPVGAKLSQVASYGTTTGHFTMVVPKTNLKGACTVRVEMLAIRANVPETQERFVRRASMPGRPRRSPSS